jgi:hypothetical protein
MRQEYIISNKNRMFPLIVYRVWNVVIFEPSIHAFLPYLAHEYMHTAQYVTWIGYL